jgi:hypothetical protein
MKPKNCAAPLPPPKKRCGDFGNRHVALSKSPCAPLVGRPAPAPTKSPARRPDALVPAPTPRPPPPTRLCAAPAPLGPPLETPPSPCLYLFFNTITTEPLYIASLLASHSRSTHTALGGTKHSIALLLRTHTRRTTLLTALQVLQVLSVKSAVFGARRERLARVSRVCSIEWCA